MEGILPRLHVGAGHKFKAKRLRAEAQKDEKEDLSIERESTQRLKSSGANAEGLAAQTGILEKSIPEGMQELVAAIERSMKAQ